MDYRSGDVDKPDLSDKALVLTTTSDGRFIDCKRLWQARYVWGVEEEKVQATAFGSVLHLCAERYLLAEGGIVPTGDLTGTSLEGQEAGSPVDIFPEGWHRFEDRDGTWREVDAIEQAKIRVLIERGIENQVLQRMPGGFVEWKYWMQIEEDIWFTSLIDYGSEEFARIVDWKTTKQLFSPWNMTDETIHENEQLAKYVMAMLTLRLPEADGIHVSHGQFEKSTSISYPKPEVRLDDKGRIANLGELNGLRTKLVSGYISRERAEEKWERTRKRAIAQFHQRKTFPGIEQWYDIPGTDESCGKYGGCPLQSVCLGIEPIPSTGTDDMEKLKPKILETARGNAPWTNPHCAACSGIGVLATGASCPLCVRRVIEDEDRRPDSFDWGFEDDTFFCRPKEAEPSTPEEAPKKVKPTEDNPFLPRVKEEYEEVPDEEETKEEPKEEPKEGVEKPVPKKAKKTDGADPVEATLSEAFPASGKRGPKKKTLILCIDGGVDSEVTGRQIVAFSRLTTAMVKDYEERQGHSFYSADPFARKDWMIEEWVEKIADYGRDKIITFDSGDFEWKRFVVAISAYAEMTFRGSK